MGLYLLYFLSQEEEYLINGSRKAAMNGSVPHKRHHVDHNYGYDPLEVTANAFEHLKGGLMKSNSKTY